MAVIGIFKLEVVLLQPEGDKLKILEINTKKNPNHNNNNNNNNNNSSHQFFYLLLFLLRCSNFSSLR